MSSNTTQLFFLLLILFLFHFFCNVDSKRIDLSRIRYHFTPCGSTGFDGPTFDQCRTHYQQTSSPIATDGVLFQFDEENFRGGQGFRIPREDVYNVTIAGAAGGRGLCNIHFGRGGRFQFQIRLAPDYELLVMVGQKGKGPCDNSSEQPLCDNPPTVEGAAAQCNTTWYTISNVTDDERRFTGGGGGGGASMLRARNVVGRVLSNFPITVVGGGGGTSTILDYAAAVELIRNQTNRPIASQPYQYYIDARPFRFTDIHEGSNNTRGYRPLAEIPILPGAGGGWTSLLSSLDTDGKPIGETFNFAKGGLDCGRFFSSLQLFEEVNGGFGGGGGECGGGGGGGGYTGGAILAYRNDVPGGGGHSVVVRFENMMLLDTLEFSFNSDDGYVDIVPANCNCSGTCAVNVTEDTFECFCPDNTTLAQDGFDCYYEAQILVNKTLEQSEYQIINGYQVQVLPFLSSPVGIFSIQAEVAVKQGSVCALAFFNRDNDMDPVAVSAPISENGSVNLFARLTVDESYSSVVLSEYMSQLTSSVETIGAILVSDGDCALIGTAIAANISTRSPQSEDVAMDFDATLGNLTMVARQILMLPITTEEVESSSATVTANPQLHHLPTRSNMTGLITGLITTIVVVLLLLIITLAAVIIIFCGWMAVSQAQVMTTENEAYAKCGPTGATEQDDLYSSQKRLDLDAKSEISSIQDQKQISLRSINNDGYEVIDYEDHNVVCKLIPTTASGTVIAPLYDIIAPTHDFTKHNRERASSGLGDWQYPRNKLIYTRELGEGQFGKVLLMKAQCRELLDIRANFQLLLRH